MPHLSIEYSASLADKADIGALCHALHNVLINVGPFEQGGVRVRAFRADHHAVADLHSENAFVDLSLRIGQGRSPEEKKLVGDALMVRAQTELAPLFETEHFALSLEIREIDADLSWKRNTIHERIRATGSNA
ncbi:5-carboxymethyl-2-hydroxymuconate Delta-isomerase [Maritalea mediterranea]|uniref:5-carboxymethyl-2-hydroxymuconate Delta-isomerase n=1 Tax=Maritalea mediterranea TaxID=2909667 RepID=A0ABS9E6U1_9HYPH|nr:5-carboxymethyl-2-hydroxymuconate Delta-isomerase [Maritalea mediterranea]MCF4097143.1 5-carboxymethyl-2-hydroxymuconate Delta-isomerase [Maritalea mediterranea]